MATLKHAESRRLYSWWWDSHISPKNSKWLQENLTDMDIKVKAMIKLIEEDADSFARRAEMYYKKRPELMKFVEEFYRAYRALAERYDHATGALRQAHRTMAEAFPNQVPMVITDDSPSSSSGTEAEPHTPEMPHPVRALFDPDDLQKDALGVSLHLPAIKRNGTHIQENDAVMSKKGLKQLNDMFASGDGTDHAKFADGRVRKGLKFQEQEKKGSENTAYNVSRDIQNHIVEENDEAERKIRTLHGEVSQLSAEKQNLGEKVLSESERADKAEDKVESLQPALAKLQSEKEAALLQYKQCLDRVSNLEAEISRGQADFSRLNGEIEEGASKLKAAEERILLLEKANQSLQSEVDLLVPRTMMQQQEITNKNEELEKLSICIQDERMHLMHAEAALQSLQSLHSQSLEEQRILALEFQHGVQMLTEMEFRKQCLEDEILKVKEENHSLSEEKISSSMSIKNLQDEIFSLKEMKGKLEEEVGLRIDQRNALQQELYCLREELNDLDRRHHDVIKQIESVGLNVDGLGSSVKDLQGENSSLKQICKDNENEKAVLSEKLENMEKLREKNSLLENSLSDASAELEGLRERLKMLEESFQSLLREKSTLDTEKSFLLSQVETIMHNVEELSEKNSMLENSLSDANVELEGLRAKSKSLDESCQVLQDEKSNLLLERDGLISQVETIRQCLENLEKRHAELEDQHLSLEKEKVSALHCINELQVSLNLEKQTHEVYIQSSQTQIISLNVEFEGLREKSKSLGESCQVLQDEKSNLLLERDGLISQVETIRQCLENLEKTHVELEDQHLSLEKEKESALHCINELQVSLNLEKQKHEVYIQSSQTQIISLNVELEGLREKSKSLGESCQVLQDEKSNLLLERDGLISQVETIRQCLENLEKRHVELEDQHLSLEKEKESALHCINELQVSLNLEKQKHEVYIQSSQTEIISLNVVLEGLREKSKSLGESCQVLQDEKSNLLLERDSLISQVETIRQYLENLEKRHADLEDQHSCMEKERESALHRVDELQISLNLEKQKYETHIKSSETQLATLGSQIHDILEEVQLRKQQIEEVQDKFMNAEVEIFVFQRCIRDMKERNLLLLIECQEHIEASVCAKKLISELEQEKLKQQMEVNSLLEENKILRTGIQHVLTSLDNGMDYGFHNTTTSEELFSLILREVKDLKNSALDTEDEKQRLLFEKTVSATLLEQLHLDASVLASEKHALEQESEMRIQELLVIQSEKHALVEMNSQLREHLCDRGEKLGVLMGEVEILHEQLSDSQKVHQILHNGSTKLHEENQSLKSEVFNLREENHTLQEENISIVGEAIAQGNLSLIFESINSEKGMELKTLNDKLDHLSGVSSELEQVRVMVNKAEAENASLKESLASMEKFRIYAATLENELNGVRNVTEELNHKVETGKNLLDQKDMELSQADEKLKAILCENAELLKEISDVKYREEKLNSDLQENINVVKQLEMEAAALYEDLQINSICLALFEEKALELICSCKSLRENIMVQERMFDDERASRNAGNDDLKEKNGALERENGGLNAELSLYLPLILSLKDSIASLEEQTLVLTDLHLTDNQETQNVTAASHLHDISGEELNGANDGKVPDGVVELQELQTRIQAVEKKIMKSGKVMMQASSITNARLEVATKEIEQLKSKSNLSQNEDVQTSKDLVVQQGKDTEPSKNVLNDKAEASKGKNELMMKDIQLDLVSDSSSHHNGVDAYGIRESGKSEADDGMLELWETAEQDSSWEPSTIKKKQQPMSADFDDMVEYHQIEAVEEQKSEYPSSELQAEKELAVDKVELSKKALESKQDGNKRILERLASDARRLTNLQATAQELKKKFEKSEKANQLLGFEYDSVKAQLKEVVEAIAQLVDMNNKLTKNTEDSSASSNSKAELEEKGNMRRRQVSERARRWSEKIGRLELEVQRIQFVMLKLESEYENKGTKGFDRRTRVLLRDYLYGGGERRRRKKVSCCVCMRPTTKSD